MNTIFIDTSSSEEISVGLETGGKKHFLKEKVGKQKAQAVLPMIDKLLLAYGLNLKDITSIDVNVGPGSYTGIRIGLSIANTLSYLLGIPLNKMPVGTFVEPVYS